MMLRVVIDVNTLASAARSPTGPSGLVVYAGFSLRYAMVSSEHILTKLDDVLGRPYFRKHLSTEQRQRSLNAIRLAVEMVVPDPSVRGIADDDEDDLVLGTAVAAGADYLVTGDHGLLKVGQHGGVTIVTAREFLAILDSE